MRSGDEPKFTRPSGQRGAGGAGAGAGACADNDRDAHATITASVDRTCYLITSVWPLVSVIDVVCMDPAVWLPSLASAAPFTVT